MTDRQYVDVHILQTVPPSNLNRDDAGSPKQAIYGGQRRARVSSQAWKRATRMAFAAETEGVSAATRTRHVSALLAARLHQRTGLDEASAQVLADDLLVPLKLSSGKKAGDTAYLLFFGREQLDGVVDLVEGQAGSLLEMSEKDRRTAIAELPIEDVFRGGHPAEVALFGRMVADLPTINVDAAAQVAHAISTHPVEIEFDYFTAVDDENPAEDTGAGMIGTVEFNSATLYRYATIGVPQLVANLGDDTDAAIQVVRRFIDGFARSIPSGHQNAFAHRTLPFMVAVMVRDDQPVNLVGAFERPVQASDGVERRSAERFIAQYRYVSEQWARPAVSVQATYVPELADIDEIDQSLGTSLPFPALLDDVADALHRQMSVSG